MSRLAEPHAGVLVNRLVDEESTGPLRGRAVRLPPLTLDDRELADLELVATGAASPLTGFMGVRDYRSVLERLRLYTQLTNITTATPGCTVTGSRLTCNLGTIATGASANVVFEADIVAPLADGTIIDNQAVIRAAFGTPALMLMLAADALLIFWIVPKISVYLDRISRRGTR